MPYFIKFLLKIACGLKMLSLVWVHSLIGKNPLDLMETLHCIILIVNRYLHFIQNRRHLLYQAIKCMDTNNHKTSQMVKLRQLPRGFSRYLAFVCLIFTINVCCQSWWGIFKGIYHRNDWRKIIWSLYALSVEFQP